MATEYKDLIKNIMKSRGFKCKSESYFMKLGDNFVEVYFTVNKSRLHSGLNYKKYSHDDIYWKILGKEELSRKKDSERIGIAAWKSWPIGYFSFIDENVNNEVIEKRINSIFSDILPEIENIDINSLVLEGEYKNSQKCLALIDLGRINEALKLSQKCIVEGESGGLVYYGKSFYQLVIERYADNPRQYLNGLGKVKVIDIPDYSYQNKEKANFDVESFTEDKAEWQYDSAQKEYCRQTGKSPAELTEQDEKIIWDYAGNHIAFFITWLLRHDYLGEMHYKNAHEQKDIEAVKKQEKTGMDILRQYCDMRFTKEDVADQIIVFVEDYYEKDYVDDYSDYMGKKVLATDFSWDDYLAFEPILNSAFNCYCG